MEDSKVSIIVPCYNVENYVSECLKSIFDQTYKNIEVICINDGSTDDTLSILNNAYQFNNRMILITQKNRGLSEARNAGLRLATGKYVMFIDSDDFIEHDTVYKGLNAMEKYEVDCVNFGMKAFADEDGADLKNVRELNEWLRHKWEHKQLMTFEKAYYTNANVCNKMYRLKDIQGKVEFIPNAYYEDIYVSWIMFYHTEYMWYEPGVQYHYRIRGGSIMTNTQSHKDFKKAMHHFYMPTNLLLVFYQDRALHKQVPCREHLPHDFVGCSSLL